MSITADLNPLDRLEPRTVVSLNNILAMFSLASMLLWQRAYEFTNQIYSNTINAHFLSEAADRHESRKCASLDRKNGSI